MFFRSERLFLRPGWPEDWSDLSTRIADAWIVRDLARAPWPYTPGDAREFLAGQQDPRCPRLVVTLPTRQGSELIGCTGLAPGEAGYELGYWIARPFWGRGYATEAARSVLSLARTLGHRRVVASHFEDNPGSARVLAKLGFKPGRRKARIWEIDLEMPCGDDDPAADMAKCAA